MEQQPKKRTQEGVVVSDTMQKTRVVMLTRTSKHPKYQKYYTTTLRVKAHDENNEYKVGDLVMIEETRPLSREKRWRIIQKIENKK